MKNAARGEIGVKRDRVSLDVSPEEHRHIKAAAALRGQTIRDYILKGVRERLQREREGGELSTLTQHLDRDPVLRQLWDNDRDAAYDRL